MQQLCLSEHSSHQPGNQRACRGNRSRTLAPYSMWSICRSAGAEGSLIYVPATNQAAMTFDRNHFILRGRVCARTVYWASCYCTCESHLHKNNRTLMRVVAFRHCRRRGQCSNKGSRLRRYGTTRCRMTGVPSPGNGTSL